jgi:hypothetical protein
MSESPDKNQQEPGSKQQSSKEKLDEEKISCAPDKHIIEGLYGCPNSAELSKTILIKNTGKLNYD